MKLPTTTEDFKNEFFKSVDMMNELGDLRMRQFIQILPKVHDEIIVEGIISIFENKNRDNTIYVDQKYAGLILKTLQPTTTIDLAVILNRIIENWNKSVEELPFWLRDNYDIETLKKTFFKIENKNLSQLATDKINTMKWLLRIKLKQ